MDIRLIEIDSIGLSKRTSNALLRNRIRTVGELLTCDEDLLFGMRNIGVKTINEIKAKKEEYAAYVAAGVLPPAAAAGKNHKNLPGDADREIAEGKRESAKKRKEEKEQALSSAKNKIEDEKVSMFLAPSVPLSLPIVPPEVNPDAYDEWIGGKEGQDFIKDWMRREDYGISLLEKVRLPRSLSGILMLYGYTNLGEVIFMTKKDIMSLPGIEDKAAEKIVAAAARYLKKNKDAILKAYETEREDAIKEKEQWEALRKESASSGKITVTDILNLEEYREDILTFVRANDRSIDSFGLSARTQKGLHQKGYTKLSDIILKSRDELLHVGFLGIKSADEIMHEVDAYLAENGERLLAFCRGNKQMLWDDTAIRNRILMCLQKERFGGLTYEKIREKTAILEDGIPEQRLKNIIGRMIGQGEIEYVDGYCYRVYPKFMGYVRTSDALDERTRNIVLLRISGETLESIGKKYGITRERIRQIVNKAIAEARNQYHILYGTDRFDEDYYRYLFENYAVDRQDACMWLGVTRDVLSYLDFTGTKTGERDLAEAVGDSEHLDAGLRLKIRNYLNHNRLFLDGRWVDKKRAPLEDYVLKTYCRNTVSFKDFEDRYNAFLDEQGIPEKDNLRITDSVAKIRKGRIASSRNVLVKQNGLFRYYDIDARDYAELVDALGLDVLENVEYSTGKFMREHPEVMKKYDIRDKYELYSLLKKILPEGSFHDLYFEKMPLVGFGHFDRDRAIMEIITDNAPISQMHLAQKIGDIYGYDPAVTMASYLMPFDDLCHNGLYLADTKELTKEHAAILRNKLSDDFYFMKEVRNIFAKAIPDGDPGEITSDSLRELGFKVYPGYVLQHYDAPEEYFKILLTEEEMTDVRPLRRRFAGIGLFFDVLDELKKNMTIVEYAQGRYINSRMLERKKITSEKISAFCADVEDFVDKNAYFDICSLKASGFTSEFIQPDMPDLFLESILLNASLFSSCIAFGARIFYSGSGDITRESFAAALVREKKKVTLTDLLGEMRKTYGCTTFPGSARVISILLRAGIIYDETKEMLYADEHLYEAALPE